MSKTRRTVLLTSFVAYGVAANFNGRVEVHSRADAWSWAVGMLIAVVFGAALGTTPDISRAAPSEEASNAA